MWYKKSVNPDYSILTPVGCDGVDFVSGGLQDRDSGHDALAEAEQVPYCMSQLQI